MHAIPMPDASIVRILFILHPSKTALELLADLLKKVHVDLVIEKHIHLENIVPDHFAVSNYALLKQLQILVPPKEKFGENTIIV